MLRLPTQQERNVNKANRTGFIPFLHLLLHVDALLLQKLPLRESPIHWFHRGFSRWRLLPFSPGLFWVVEPEHMVLSHYNTVAWKEVQDRCDRNKHDIWQDTVFLVNKLIQQFFWPCFLNFKSRLLPSIWLASVKTIQFCCSWPTDIKQKSNLYYYDITVFSKNAVCTWTKLDCIFNTLAIDIGFWSITGY